MIRNHACNNQHHPQHPTSRGTAEERVCRWEERQDRSGNDWQERAQRVGSKLPYAHRRAICAASRCGPTWVGGMTLETTRPPNPSAQVYYSFDVKSLVFACAQHSYKNLGRSAKNNLLRRCPPQRTTAGYRPAAEESQENGQHWKRETVVSTGMLDTSRYVARC